MRLPLHNAVLRKARTDAVASGNAPDAGRRCAHATADGERTGGGHPDVAGGTDERDDAAEREAEASSRRRERLRVDRRIRWAVVGDHCAQT